MSKFNFPRLLWTIRKVYTYRVLLKHFNHASFFDLVKTYVLIRQIDKHIIGRYCGSFEDKIIQAISAIDISKQYRRHSNAIHVDIGVLFGGSSIVKAANLQRL